MTTPTTPGELLPDMHIDLAIANAEYMAIFGLPYETDTAATLPAVATATPDVPGMLGALGQNLETTMGIETAEKQADARAAVFGQKVRLAAIREVELVAQVAELKARLTPKKQAAHLIITLRDAEYCAGAEHNEFDAKAEAAAKELGDYIASCESSCAELTSQNLRLTNELASLRAWAATLPAELRKI